mmetsp:Transcript_48868/g.156525  ORF Transcript_48868/g.156525 Transcript_48868/m.156525 type:complete len:374 (+) Transcript_48868:49-1170(+)
MSVIPVELRPRGPVLVREPPGHSARACDLALGFSPHASLVLLLAAPRGAERVDFIQEHHCGGPCRRIRLGRLKHAPQVLLRLARKGPEHRGRARGVHPRPALFSDRLHEEGFAAPRGAVEEKASGPLDPEGLGLTVVTQRPPHELPQRRQRGPHAPHARGGVGAGGHRPGPLSGGGCGRRRGRRQCRRLPGCCGGRVEAGHPDPRRGRRGRRGRGAPGFLGGDGGGGADAEEPPLRARRVLLHDPRLSAPPKVVGTQGLEGGVQERGRDRAAAHELWRGRDDDGGGKGDAPLDCLRACGERPPQHRLVVLWAGPCKVPLDGGVEEGGGGVALVALTDLTGPGGGCAEEGCLPVPGPSLYPLDVDAQVVPDGRT